MKSTSDIAPVDSDSEEAEPVILDAANDAADSDLDLRARGLAEARREEALNAHYHWSAWSEADQAWLPYRLQELCMERWHLWQRMERYFAPLPVEDWLVPEHEQALDSAPSTWTDRHVPSALSLIFLCSHREETLLELAPLPKLYWASVYAWGKKHCPGERWQEALDLMRLMEKRTKESMSTPRSTGRRGSSLGE